LVSTRPVNPKALVERLRDVHRFLAGHRVDDEQCFGRRHQLANRFQLARIKVVVDVQAAGGVDDQRVEQISARVVAALADDLRHVLPRPASSTPARAIEAARNPAAVRWRRGDRCPACNEQRLAAALP
jgi:hypothetical protein